MALVTAQTEHSAAQTNFSDQITTYNNIKMRLDTTSIAWPDTPSLHQVVVDDATALKAQALVVQAARDTYYAKGNASEDAQANYTSAAANATTADEGVATAQAERDVACAPLSIAPSPPPTPPPPTPPPPTSITRSTTNPFTSSPIQQTGMVFGTNSFQCSNTGGGVALSPGAPRSGVTGIHCLDNLNDGTFDNAHSWIPGTSDAKAGIVFSTLQMVTGIALSRDRTATYTDRTGGTITIQVTDNLSQDFASLTGSESWFTVGSAQSKSTPSVDYYAFSQPVAVGALRILVSSGDICIDELEIY
jgi:hypothetical protein